MRLSILKNIGRKVINYLMHWSGTVRYLGIVLERQRSIYLPLIYLVNLRPGLLVCLFVCSAVSYYCALFFYCSRDMTANRHVPLVQVGSLYNPGWKRQEKKERRKKVQRTKGNFKPSPFLFDSEIRDFVRSPGQ